MTRYDKNQTHLYVTSESIADKSELIQGSESTKEYVARAGKELESAEQMYDDLDVLERVEVGKRLDSNAVEYKDLLSGPDEDFEEWVEKEPVVVAGIALASELNKGLKKPASSDERELMQDRIESVLADMYKRSEDIQSELDGGEVGGRRAGEFERSINHLNRASASIVLETARKKKLGRW